MGEGRWQELGGTDYDVKAAAARAALQRVLGFEIVR